MVLFFKNCNIVVMIRFAVLIFAMFLMSCESVEEDARNTPIGSVVSGKTKSVETYVERVKAQNKAESRDVWRPTSNERF